MAAYLFVAIIVCGYVAVAVGAVRSLRRDRASEPLGLERARRAGSGLRGVAPAPLPRAAMLACRHEWQREWVLIPEDHKDRLVEWTCRRCGASTWEGDSAF